MNDLLGSVFRSKIAWLFVALSLIIVWLFKGNGFYQIATVVLLVGGGRLVGPPVEFAELCERYAGVNVYRTVPNVAGVFYISAIFTRARENELELPVIGINDLQISTNRTNDIRHSYASAPDPEHLRSLLGHYEFVETVVKSNDRSLYELSSLSERGLYRFSRGRSGASGVCQRVGRAVDQSPVAPSDELERRTGNRNFCIHVEKIQSVSARWEYVAFVDSRNFLTYETAISNGHIDVERKVARDAATGDVVADATNFSWTDSVRGGRFDRPNRPCDGVGNFPYVTKVFLSDDAS